MTTQASGLRSPAQLSGALQRTAGLLGIATARADGTVEHSAGKLDADTLCAVVVMAQAQVQAATDELGLGNVRSWWLAAESGIWYVVSARSGFIVAAGEPTKNPEAVLRVLAAEGGDR